MLYFIQQQFEEEFIQMFGYEDKPPPPASKEFVKNLPQVVMEQKGEMLYFDISGESALLFWL